MAKRAQAPQREGEADIEHARRTAEDTDHKMNAYRRPTPIKDENKDVFFSYAMCANSYNTYTFTDMLKKPKGKHGAPDMHLNNTVVQVPGSWWRERPRGRW